jgi:hypothetical protein
MLAAMAGYSGTPLPRKLGIGPGSTVALVAAPEEFEAVLEPLPPGATLRTDLRARPDLVVWFVRSSRELRPGRLDRLADGRPLWIAWPKKSSGVETDLTENVVRDAGLSRGLVDTKVCAIDEVWSGLRLVVRKELR